MKQHEQVTRAMLAVRFESGRDEWVDVKAIQGCCYSDVRLYGAAVVKTVRLRD